MVRESVVTVVNYPKSFLTEQKFEVLITYNGWVTAVTTLNQPARELETDQYIMGTALSSTGWEIFFQA